jgi:hypothetical protein
MEIARRLGLLAEFQMKETGNNQIGMCINAPTISCYNYLSKPMQKKIYVFFSFFSFLKADRMGLLF